MSRWADWLTLRPGVVARLRVASSSGENSDAAVLELLQPWLENLEKLPLHVQIDKAWEPIHRCLTGDHGAAHQFDPGAGEYPLKLCVLGGEHLLSGWARTAALIAAKEVPVLAVALASLRKEWLRERFFALPGTQFHEIDEDTFEWTWAHFQDLPLFFAKAAETGDAVLCTVSH
jgi:hypothetical protein